MIAVAAALVSNGKKSTGVAGFQLDQHHDWGLLLWGVTSELFPPEKEGEASW
jgi:hypothetical protein